jgi:hypothetical protein
MATSETGAPSPADPGPPRWFLVANGSRARAYLQRVGAPGYDVLREWKAPEARMTSHELGEDRADRVFGAAGATGRSAIEPEDSDATPKGHARHEFLETLAAPLTQVRAGEHSGLYLVAPALMPHRLRNAFPTDLCHAVLGEHAGGFTQRPNADVFHRFDRLRHEAGGEPPLGLRRAR